MATAQQKKKDKNLKKKKSIYKTICAKLQYVVETTYVFLY